jgi:Flp pilus assembly protein TadG
MRVQLRRDERGAVAIIVAFLAVVLCLMAGFVVDFGQAYVVKRQMQTAADAGALAAASAYSGYPGDCPTLLANAGAKAKAQLEANKYRALNDSSDTSVIRTACVDGMLQVAVDAAGQSPTYFAPLAGGGSQIGVQRTATASVSVSPRVPGGLRPLALCAAQMPSPLISGNVVRIDYPGDGHKIFPGCPDTGNPGAWWTLDCPGERLGSTSQGLEVQIKEGCPEPVSIVNPQDPTTPASLSKSLTDACPTAPLGSETCLEGDPGQMDSGQIEDSWRYLIDREITVILPVFCSPLVCVPTTVVGTGTNAVFPVYKLASMRVCGYHFSKSTRYEFYNGDCASHVGLPSVMTDGSKDNYLLVAFKAVATSGGTKDFNCQLGAGCDGGLRRVLLVN